MPSRRKPTPLSRSSTELEEGRVVFRNEINVQGAGLELRHVELSLVVVAFPPPFSLPPCRPETKGNAVSPHVETGSKENRENGVARDRKALSSLFARSREWFCHSHVLPSRAVHCRSSSTSRDRNSFRPFSLASGPLFFSRSLALSRNIPCNVSCILVGSSSQLLRPGRISPCNHA